MQWQLEPKEGILKKIMCLTIRWQTFEKWMFQVNLTSQTQFRVDLSSLPLLISPIVLHSVTSDAGGTNQYG